MFIELLRRKKEVYYHKIKKECDFLVKEGLNIIQAFQVSYSLLDFDTKTREINGLLKALEQYNLPEGIIITENEEDEIEVDKKSVKVIPIWKWLLD